MTEGITTDGTANTGISDGAGDVWYGGFPDELKASELITKHENPESLANDYLNINKQYTELQSSLPQLPDSPESYELEIPEGAQVDEDMVGWFKNAAFEHKVPVDTAKNLVAGFLQKQQEATERAREQFQAQVNKEVEDGTKALQQAWGDKFDARIGKLEHIIATNMSDEAREFIKNSGVGRDPAFIQGLWGIVSKLDESEFVAGDAVPQKKEAPKDAFGRDRLRFPSME